MAIAAAPQRQSDHPEHVPTSPARAKIFGSVDSSKDTDAA
ncbi:hypothetical protein SGL43_03057 [Streptomyces globisporus]|uniref:Uncharacterized protein n=1 Tax=Streptomyces globisporus TaxID=1908 RepID=A0ABN8V0K5_STRGL|nr:hypothetical protein SGL43_03057 [Streptomyces globisporus]